ncbi:uncharacterized protein LOC108192615 isoform X2 [Daucus carota subsp. sativus]|uniref:uncharacterized protein LOC108192615 isoform X2 n=1 Tax=Daucus carota subsp. sativus TaxID=79200 RepID=UPI003082CE61
MSVAFNAVPLMKAFITRFQSYQVPLIKTLPRYLSPRHRRYIHRNSWNRVLLLRLQDHQDVRSVHGFLAIQCCFRFLLVLLIDIGSLSPAFLKRDFVGRIEPTLKFLSSSPGQMSICRENENVVGRREKG